MITIEQKFVQFSVTVSLYMFGGVISFRKLFLFVKILEKLLHFRKEHMY